MNGIGCDHCCAIPADAPGPECDCDCHDACPACGSTEHDGWTNHDGCPEDWTEYSKFEVRRWIQLTCEEHNAQDGHPDTYVRGLAACREALTKTEETQ